MVTRTLGNDFKINVTTQARSRVVDEFYKEYAKAFVLPDERESLSGFRICLSLNGPRGADLHAQFGLSREHIAIVRDPTGGFVSGMNFICFPMEKFGKFMTVHSMYVFVSDAWRGKGMLRRAYQIMGGIAGDYAREVGLPDSTELVFIGEQNDPFRMTLDAYRKDTAASGLNQFDRMAIWGRLGARVLHFPYVQPALSPESAPDATLFLRAILSDESNILPRPTVRPVNPAVLQEHLRRFFAITVLKGRRSLTALPEVNRQLVALDSHISEGRPILAYEMPPNAKLLQWKSLAREILTRRDNPGETMLGALLGITSVQESLAS